MTEEMKNEVAAAPEVAEQAPKPKITKQKRNVIIGVVIAIVVVAGAGFWVWHEQPSFCAAICHSPMDKYLSTYEQPINTVGTDKWGNTVSDTSAMGATLHGAAGLTCMGCHQPAIDQQIGEGAKWITGGYEYPLNERKLSQLVAYTHTSDESFCLNKGCHNMTKEDLVSAVANLSETRNPHAQMHGVLYDCGDCHKGHRASVNMCSECHDDAPIPSGWVTAQESNALMKGQVKLASA